MRAVLCLSCLLLSAVVHCYSDSPDANGGCDHDMDENSGGGIGVATMLEGSATAVKLNWTCDSMITASTDFNVAYNNFKDTVKGTSTILFNLDSTEDYNVTVSAVGSDVCCIAVSFNIANLPNFSPPDSANQVERVWATLDYPYENISSDMFSAQIVWTPLPGVTQYQVIIQNFELENIFGSPFNSSTNFFNVKDSNSRYPLQMNTRYIARVQGRNCVLSEPIMISAKASELILIVHDASEAHKGLIYLQNGELHTIYDHSIVSRILGPVAINKRSRKIFFAMQGAIMMSDINELEHQTVIQQFPDSFTVHAMTYDWIANELYVAVSYDKRFRITKITIHTMEIKELYESNGPIDAKLTINPFTRLLHWITITCSGNSISSCQISIGSMMQDSGNITTTNIEISNSSIPIAVAENIYTGCVYYYIASTNNRIIEPLPESCLDLELPESRGLTYDPVSFYALSNNQTMIIQINDSRVYDLPFEISPSHNVRVFESLSIGTQPLTNDIRCLTPASLEIQHSEIFNYTCVQVAWTVQWPWDCSYSRPPVMYTVLVESLNGSVEYNEVMYTAHISIPVAKLSSNTNYNIIIAADTEFTTESLSNNTAIFIPMSPKGSGQITPSTLVAYPGDDVTFQCTADGGPNDVYMWLFDAIGNFCVACSDPQPNNITSYIADVLSSTMTISVVGMDPLLEIVSVNASNGGSYHCIIFNDAGFETVDTNLSVAPLFIVQPQSINREVNEYTNFTCETVSFPNPYYQWQRYVDGQFESIPDTNTPTLTFRVASDSYGLYRCVASIPGAKVNSSEALLTVSPRGSVSIMPTAALAVSGDMRTFTCTADGGPNNTFEWLFKDSVVFTGSVYTVTADESTFGMYTCQVSNGAGYDSNISTLFLSPKGSGHIEQSTFLAYSGETVTFECTAGSGPNNTFMWLFDPAERFCIACSDPMAQLGNVTSYLANVQSSSMTVTVVGTEPLLEIMPVNALHGGSYQCVIFNNAGFETVDTNLSVAPLFIVQPQSIDREVNEYTNFTCEAVSFPNPYYQWQRYVDGQFESIPDTNTPTLTFRVASDSYGLYRCVASIPGAKVNSSEALLTVSPRGSVSIMPTAALAVSGDMRTFTCTADGGPNNTFEWLFKDSVVFTGSVYTVTADESTFGMYTCQVSNGAGYDSNISTLFLSPEGSGHIEQSTFLAYSGETVTFECTAGSGPNNTFMWLFDPADRFCIPCSDPVAQLGNVTSYLANVQSSSMTVTVVGTKPFLEIMSVNASHGGSYQCVIFNNAGFETVDTNLSVAPLFIVQPQSIDRKVNEYTNLTCEAVSFPNPYYQWQRYIDGQFENISDANTSMLMLQVASDSYGLYRCVASIPGAEEYSNEALVTVSPKGSGHIAPSTLLAYPGDDVTFQCTAGGGPNNTYMWLFLTTGNCAVCREAQPDNITGYIADVLHSNVTIVGMESMLEITSVNASHGGMYQCVVINNAGFEIVDTNQSVAPLFIVQPQSISREVDEDANFTCEAVSFPNPHYRWQRYVDGQFEDIPDASTSVLTFQVTSSSFRRYRCVASIPDADVYSSEALLTDITSLSQSQTISIIAGSVGGAAFIILLLSIIATVACTCINMRKRKAKELEISKHWISSDQVSNGNNTRYAADNLVLQNPVYDMPLPNNTSGHPKNTNGGIPDYVIPVDSLNSALQYEVPSQTNTFNHANASNTAQNDFPPSYSSINTQELDPEDIYTAPLPTASPNQPEPSTYSMLTSVTSIPNNQSQDKDDPIATDHLYFQLESSNKEGSATELEQPSASDAPQERVYFELENTESPKENMYFELEDPDAASPERLYSEIKHN